MAKRHGKKRSWHYGMDYTISEYSAYDMLDNGICVYGPSYFESVADFLGVSESTARSDMSRNYLIKGRYKIEKIRGRHWE